jgi:hypothetical protein
LADQCQSIDTNWVGFNVQRYRSDNDNICWPLPISSNSDMQTWVLGEGSPLIRFTGVVHNLTLAVPANRIIANANAEQVQIWIQTGSDDLRGGANFGGNANALLTVDGRGTSTNNLNGGNEWGNGQTHVENLLLPTGGAPVKDISGLTITIGFGGGLNGDNWNVNKVALIIAVPHGSDTSQASPLVIHDWLDVSGGPLIRMTGSVHDITEPVAPQDVGQSISALQLITSTGNDDLRGGSNPGDNCDVTIALASGQSIGVTNANQGDDWQNFTDHTVAIPLPAGELKGGDVTSVSLHTNFGGNRGRQLECATHSTTSHAPINWRRMAEKGTLNG